MLNVLVNWTIVIAWIFGGCCSNVYALEAIIRDEPDSGLLITFAQFVLTALMSYPSHFSPRPSQLCLKPRAVPLMRWVPNIVMFFVVNLLNNYAFGYNISVPVHIILRSGGSVMTMVVGYAWGKRYTRLQGGGSHRSGNALFGLDNDAERDIVSSVILLTTGIVMAAMADAKSKGKTTSTSPSAFSLTSIDSELLTGLSILFIAQLLSALMGLYVQLTYAKYGSHWHENLFYSHALSIPLFLPLYPSLSRQFQKIMSSPEVTIIPDIYLNSTKAFGESSQLLDLPPILLASTSFIPHTLPKNLVTLALNALTQFACIRGVNLLASQTSAVGVSVALNVRKLVSLFISIKLFGNVLPFGVKVGAGVVFASAGLWAWEEKRLGDGRQREKVGGEAEGLGEGEAKKVQ